MLDSDSQHYKQSEVQSLLWLYALTIAVILPFSLYRLSQEEWLIGFIDLFAAILAGGLFIYLKKNRRPEIPGLVFSILCLLTAFATVYINGPALAYWSYPSIMAVFYILTPKRALLLNGAFFISFMVMLWIMHDHFQFFTVLVTLGVTFIVTYIFSRSRYQQTQQLISQASIDALTGVGNRRSLMQKVEHTVHLCRRQGVKVTLIMIDIDFFKQINDTYGHDVGDQALANTSQQIHSMIRKTDSLYRYGGEEFVIVSDGTSLIDAQQLAEKIRKHIESTEVIKQTRFTISLGVAEYQTSQSPEEWIKAADLALFKAKNMGRNKVCLA